MEAKELRIGNWVELIVEEGDEMVDSFEPITQIQSIDYDVFTPTEKVYFISSSNEDVAYMGMVKPIPLTEEWLVKFGFVSNPYQDIYAKVSDTISFVIDVDKTRGYLELYSKGVDLKHVHQLQNLYFALTGEELSHDI